MKTEKVAIASLTHSPNNVRIHTETQLAELCRSVKMFGQIRPVVVDENSVVLAGNGLVEACRRNGEENIIIYRIEGLTEAEKVKLTIADNRVYALGLDDNESMLRIISELQDFDIPGFEEGLLEELLADTGAVDDIIEGYGKLEEERILELEDQEERREERIKTAIEKQSEKEDLAPGDRIIVCPHCKREILLRGEDHANAD